MVFWFGVHPMHLLTFIEKDRRFSTLYMLTCQYNVGTVW